MVTRRDISYDADSRTMVGTLALPDGSDLRPGVLVSHEGPGLDDHARDIAVRLAELGYVVFALDYHGDGRPIADRGQMMARIGELRADPMRTRAIGTAGLDVLRAEARTDPDRLAAIGYCFGGTVSFELARSGADLKAVVGFHAGLGTACPEDAARHPWQGAGLDRGGRPDRHERRPAGVRGGDARRRRGLGAHRLRRREHSFTRHGADGAGIPGVRYDEATDRRSWRAMLDLFEEAFG